MCGLVLMDAVRESTVLVVNGIATNKQARAPFEGWSIDMVTNLTPPMANGEVHLLLLWIVLLNGWKCAC